MAKLKATTRSEIGSRQAQGLRKKGLVPCVVYGHGKETQSISLNEHEVELVLLRGERLLEIDLEGTVQNALIKDIQYDAFGNVVLHIDLTRVDLDERVEVTVVVVLKGTPAGANEGGVLQQVANEVVVECTVRSIPEELTLFVNEMKIGDSLHLSDLELPEGAKLVDDPESVLCTIAVVAEEEEAPVEEGEETLEPKVIGEKKEEGEEEGEKEQ